MDRHAERIRRIQELCARLSNLIEESHRIQHTAEELHRESKALLDDLERSPESEAGEPIAG